jgi:hypothetical protein
MKPGTPVNVKLDSTTPVVNADGNYVFQEGIILRRVSKFLIGAQEDGLIPVPVFIDPKSGKILIELLPAELRKEYAELQGETVVNGSEAKG